MGPLILLRSQSGKAILQNGGRCTSQRAAALKSVSLPRQARLIRPGCKQIRSKLGQTLRENSLTTSACFFFISHSQTISRYFPSEMAVISLRLVENHMGAGVRRGHASTLANTQLPY